jgi:hypothetical protein
MPTTEKKAQAIEILAITVVIDCDNCGAIFSVRLPLGCELKNEPPLYYYEGSPEHKNYLRMDDFTVVCSICRSPSVKPVRTYPIFEMRFKGGNGEKKDT